MLKKILAIVVGALAGGTLVWLVQTAGHVVYPPPADLDPKDLEQLKAHVAEMPLGAFLFVLAAYVVGSFGAGWLSGKIARTMGPPIFCGLLLLLGGVANVLLIPHPLWFTIASLAVYLPFAWFGGRFAGAGKKTA